MRRGQGWIKAASVAVVVSLFLMTGCSGTPKPVETAQQPPASPPAAVEAAREPQEEVGPEPYRPSDEEQVFLAKQFAAGLLLPSDNSSEARGRVIPVDVQSLDATDPKQFDFDLGLRIEDPSSRIIQLDRAGIEAMNNDIMAHASTMTDLRTIPLVWSASDVRSKIFRHYDGFEWNRGYTTDGNLTSESQRAGWINNADESLSSRPDGNPSGADVALRKAVLVKRVNVRALPIEEPLFEDGNPNFDLLQCSADEAGEPVVVLHESKDRQWAFIISNWIWGWVPSSSVASVDDATFDKYLKLLYTPEPNSFAMVTDATATIDDTLFQLGAKLPLKAQSWDSLTVTVPTAAPASGNTGIGALVEKDVVVTSQDFLRISYYPYTVQNVIASALTFSGHVYGWGGRLDSVDCSFLLRNAFKTVGVMLPPNSLTSDGLAVTHIDLSSMDRAQKLETLNTLGPGAAVFFNGHVALYLGTYDGDPYVFHSYAVYYNENGEKIPRFTVECGNIDSLIRSIDGGYRTYLDRAIDAYVYK